MKQLEQIFLECAKERLEAKRQFEEFKRDMWAWSSETKEKLAFLADYGLKVELKADGVLHDVTVTDTDGECAVLSPSFTNDVRDGNIWIEAPTYAINIVKTKVPDFPDICEESITLEQAMHIFAEMI